MPILKSQLRRRAHELHEQFMAIDLISTTDLANKMLIMHGRNVLKRLKALLESNSLKPTLISDLKSVLLENWNFIKGGVLCYTTLPEDPLTLFLCDVVQFLVESTPVISAAAAAVQAEPLNAIKILMPDICTESIDDEIASLEPFQDETTLEWRHVDLRQILKTHVLSQDGLSLLPLNILARVSLDEPNQQIINPYYDYKQPKMLPYLGEEEKERLFEHSVFSRAIFDAQKSYGIYLSDQSNLLSHLRQLCSHLAFNSVHESGTETVAGQGAYGAIIAFNTYYQAIDKEREKIPVVIRTEIEKLLKVTSDPSANIVATQNTETCVVRRRQSLLSAIVGHEKELSEIALVGESKASQILQARAQFELAKQALSAALTSKQVGGIDKLPIQVAMLDKLGIDFTVSSANDLQCLQRLSPRELENVFSKIPALKNQFVQQLATIDNLILFILGTSPTRVKIILSAFPSLIIHHFIPTDAHLAALLIPLDPERCYIVCETLKRNLFPEAFVSTLPHLHPEQFTIVSNAMISRIETAKSFSTVYKIVRGQHLAIIFDLSKRIFPNIIRSASDLGLILHFCPIEQVRKNLEGFYHLIKTSEDLVSLLGQIHADKQGIICEFLWTHSSSSFLHSVQDFLIIYKCLSANLKTIFFNAVHEILPIHISNMAELLDILRCLSFEQGVRFFRLCLHITQKQFDSLHQLNEAELSAKFNKKEMAVIFMYHIGTIEGLMIFISQMSAVQLHYILSAISPIMFKSTEIIANAQHLLELLNNLNEEKCRVVCQAFKNHCNPIYFKQILPVLNMPHFYIVAGIVLEKDLSSEELQEIFLSLSLQQKQIMLDLIVHSFPQKINYQVLHHVLIRLQTEQILLIPSILDAASSVLRTKADVVLLLQGLPVMHCKVVCEIIKNHFMTIITSWKDIEYICLLIDRVRGELFFSAIVNVLPAFVLTIKSLSLALSKLDDEQGALLFELFLIAHSPFEHLEELTLTELTSLFTHDYITQAFINYLAELGPDNFINFITKIHPEKLPAIFRSINCWSALVKTSQDLICLLKMNGEHTQFIFTELIKCLNHSVFITILDYFDSKKIEMIALNLLMNLNDPMGISPTEIMELLARPGMKTFFIEYLVSIEKLKTFIVTTSPMRLQSVFTVIGKEMFGDAENKDRIQLFNDVIHDLDVPAFQMACGAFKHQINPIYFIQALPSLEAKKITIVMNILLEKKITISNLRTILQSVDLIQPSSLLDLLEYSYRDVLNSPIEISALLSIFHSSRTLGLTNRLMYFLVGMIKTTKDIVPFLQYLDVEQCNAFFKAINPHLISLISEWKDIENLSQLLNQEQDNVFFSTICKVLPNFTLTVQSLIYAIGKLNSEQGEHLFAVYSKKTPLPPVNLKELNAAELVYLFKSEKTHQCFADYLQDAKSIPSKYLNLLSFVKASELGIPTPNVSIKEEKVLASASSSVEVSKVIKPLLTWSKEEVIHNIFKDIPVLAPFKDRFLEANIDGKSIVAMTAERLMEIVDASIARKLIIRFRNTILATEKEQSLDQPPSMASASLFFSPESNAPQSNPGVLNGPPKPNDFLG